MASNKTRARVGAAVFAAGLSLSAPHGTGIASADSADAGSVSAGSASKTSVAHSARKTQPSRSTPATRGSASRPRAAAGPARRLPKSVLSVSRRVSPALARPARTELPAAVVTAVAVTAVAAVPPVPAVTCRTCGAVTAFPGEHAIAAALGRAFNSVANLLSRLPANPVTDFLEGGLLLVRRTFFPFLTQGPECVTDKSCFGANLTAADLSGKDLTGVNFTRAELANADLSGADLTGALLSYADLTGANLHDATLTGVTWHRTTCPDGAKSSSGCSATTSPPSITIHNSSGQTIWVYNLTTSGNYSIPAGFTPVQVQAGDTTAVTLAVGTAAAGSPENRIYIVEGSAGFTLPVSSPGGVDAFNPTAPTAGNSFDNYSFLEYNYYAVNGGYQYTIDTSYIDEWSLPIQLQFHLNGADWSGAQDGKTYGFNDFDTVVNQLTTAGGPYADLVWSGTTPWSPYPPATVSRIIGPDKVWTQQSTEPASNINMNNTGWVPASYQDFVQYGSVAGSYPYAYNGTQYSTDGNFTFWKTSVSGPGSTPYPIALRTAAVLDGFPADANGVYGFFTYPNDETAGQFTNIPDAVSLDVYVFGTSDGVSDSVITGGTWLYSSSSAATPLHGTDATDTYVLDHAFASGDDAPLLDARTLDHDVVVIDKAALDGATSSSVDIVTSAQFGDGGAANYTSQFVYETSTGYLYFDRDPDLPGYTAVLANLSGSSIDPSSSVFVL
ncbi:pentapeptide repeat-containing protein [Mycobacterium sp. CVI_P3]|uniref:Pentapeptide repeat-containing protein n=1 Tax=Mycobacterium pinniadriaticum TaxID=2994102 RepID=A0ABT3S9M9_9MYCO|nr:pentapeptide repeat-containing protein [Mycobacterium pinniadriaticum]MCX2929770.1 pentapeptide repeat-containing protein [Mycobacterium pinniadriaticum]MCX2936194.1 pentapeptide repeat-containing protein [Mycobacterium pinniadriaticum]